MVDRERVLGFVEIRLTNLALKYATTAVLNRVCVLPLAGLLSATTLPEFETCGFSSVRLLASPGHE